MACPEHSTAAPNNNEDIYHFSLNVKYVMELIYTKHEKHDYLLYILENRIYIARSHIIKNQLNITSFNRCVDTMDAAMNDKRQCLIDIYTETAKDIYDNIKVAMLFDNLLLLSSNADNACNAVRVAIDSL